jgi:hypothetical protein
MRIPSLFSLALKLMPKCVSKPDIYKQKVVTPQLKSF